MDQAEQNKEDVRRRPARELHGHVPQDAPGTRGRPLQRPLRAIPAGARQAPPPPGRLAAGILHQDAQRHVADGRTRRRRQQLAKLRQAGTLRRIKRFANALIDGVPVRDKDRPGSDVNLLDWLRQCRRAGLYEQGKAIYEKGGLNLANLTDEQQIEAEDDYRICVRRGNDEVAKPRRERKTKRADDE